MTHSSGLHHITAICSDPERMLSFYTQLLGLRLVKRTVNFDDPSAWHLYIGDEVALPGSLLTFFARPEAEPGLPGAGEVVTLSLAIPPGSSGYWADRLVEAGVPFAVGHDDTLVFHDPDGLGLELVERRYAGEMDGYDSAEVPADRSPRGIANATVLVSDGASMRRVMVDVLGWQQDGEATVGEFARTRYIAPGPDGLGTSLEVLVQTAAVKGEPGAGSVHHIAFRAADDRAQAIMGDRLKGLGLSVTEQRDRSYFRSIYARDTSGLLVEVATDGPGFFIDETFTELGKGLKLPAALEERRAEIEAALPELD